MLFNNIIQLRNYAIYHLVCIICTLYLGIQADGSNSPQSHNNSNTNSNQYHIKFIQNETKNNVAYVSILQVTPASSKQIDFRSEFHIELKYQSKHPYVTIDERAPNNTVVAAIVVGGINEDDIASGRVSLSIDKGNELNHFKLVITPFTNTIQVNGAPLSKQNVPEYNLTIVVKEHGPSPRSSSTNLVIKLHTSLPPLGSNVPSEPLQGSKPPVNDLMYVGVTLVVIFFIVIFVIIFVCALVQTPKSKKSPPPRTTSSTASRIHPSDHCLCLGLTNL